MTALRRQERPLQVGVVGLGTGTMAAYSRPGDHWVFYEIDSEVVRIARTGAWFSYLEDARPTPSIVLGDARVSLAREAPRGFDLIVLDAFSSDAIPIHLITREAFDLYKRHLAAGGVIAVHVSNRHLVLAPVVARIAEAVGWRAILQVQATTPSAAREGISTSRWLVVAPPDRFESLGLRGPAWRAEVGDGQAPWTDDYSNLVSVIHWQ